MTGEPDDIITRERNLTMTTITLKLLAALKDLLGDQPSVQNFQCIRCGRDYHDIDELAIETGDCPSDDCPSHHARAAIAEAEAMAANSPPAEAEALLPIVTVTVRGGLIEDLDATIPAHVIVEDHDVEDYDTGKKPARSVWELAGGLSGPKAERLRRLIAND
ncbi:MAG: hypothetical protein ACJ8AW_30725 [Rhodopila sp.]